MGTRLNASVIFTDSTLRARRDVLGLYDRQLTTSLPPDMETIRTLGYCLTQLGSDHWLLQHKTSSEQIHLYSRHEIAAFIHLRRVACQN